MPDWFPISDFPWLYSYAGLFVVAFVAASLLPLGSEWLLVLLLSQGGDPFALWLAASSGNILGSVLNYALGWWARDWVEARHQGTGWARAQRWYSRYGVWSLLFAWLPVVGDPLTLVAGVLRTRFVWFLPLVALGKSGRYALLILALL